MTPYMGERENSYNLNHFIIRACMAIRPDMKIATNSLTRWCPVQTYLGTVLLIKLSGHTVWWKADFSFPS
jgi:hypothetical protein